MKNNFKTPADIFSAISDKGIEFYNLSHRFVESIVNSQVSPQNGVINPERDKSLPLTYNGIRGIIMFKAPHSYESVFKENLVHLLVGGQTSKSAVKENTYECMYNFCIFIDDFPLIKQRYDEILIMKIVRGEPQYVSYDDLNS